MPLQSHLLGFGGRMDPSRPSLPVEVEEHALSYLDRWEDATTIASCAQVCSHWLPSTRYKLYSKVALPSCERWQLFERTLLSQDPSPLGGVARYLGTVRKLIIGPFSEPEDDHFDEKCWNWATTAFVGCAPYLTEVTHIVLSWIVWEARRELNDLRRYPNLETLDTRSCHFVDIADMHDLVMGFPTLKNLCIGFENLENGDWPDSVSDTETLPDLDFLPGSNPLNVIGTLTMPAVLPQLSRLEVEAWPVAMPAICSWLINESWPVQHLTEVVWRPMNHKYKGPIPQDYRISEWFSLDILKLIPSLEVLHCTTDICIDLSAPQLANLKSLDILYEDAKWSGLLEMIECSTNGLDNGESVRPLEEAHFEFRVPSWPGRATDLTELQTVAGTLSSPALAKLHTFTLTLTLSARPSRRQTTWPMDLRTSSVADVLAKYDTTPMTSDELLATTAFSNPGLDTAAWVDLLVGQTESILQRRIQAQFESVSSRFTVNIVVAMKIWLDGTAHGFASNEGYYLY